MSSKCIKLLKQGSDSGAKPVFILPVVSGTTGCFDNLIGSCDKFKRTVYGLTDPYLTGEQASMNLPTREMVSKYYVEAIMSKQSKGPYTLMGYSQGGQWTWAVADVLINDKKQVVEQMVLLDPVYPTWDHGERCYNWMPKLFPVVVPPTFFFPEFLLKMLVTMNNKGYGINVVDGKTEAARAAHMAKLIDVATQDLNKLETMMVFAEADTGVVVADEPMAFLKAQPKGDAYTAMVDKMAEAFPGLEKGYINKVFETFATAPFRASLLSPCKLPKETKVLVINPQRMGFKSPAVLKNTPLSTLLYPVLGEKYELSLCKEQGLYELVEEGESQMREVNVPMPAELQGAAKAMNKFKGESAPFVNHFRLLHEPVFQEAVKKEALIPFGII